MSSDGHWRWVDRKGVQRELTEDALQEALRSGMMGKDVPVWRPGMESFDPAGRVPELAEWCRGAPASTPANTAPIGKVVQATGPALEAMLRMVNREKRGRTVPLKPASKRADEKPAAPPDATPKPEEKPAASPTLPEAPARKETAASLPPVPPPTVPPPAQRKKTAIMGSVAPAGFRVPEPETKPVPQSKPIPGTRPLPRVNPLPPSPVAAVAPRLQTPLQMPPPAPVAKTSAAAVTYAQMPAPTTPPGQVDTPPATPLAIHAERSSPPAKHVPTRPLGYGQPAGQPAQAQPPSRLDMTQPSASMKAEFEREMARRRRMRILLPVFGVVGVIVLIGLVGILVRVFRSKPSTDPIPAASSVAAAESSTPAPATSAEAPPPKTKKPAVACVYTGPRKRLVVGASKDVPLEVWSDPKEPSVAVGFAARNQTALGFVLDPKTLSPQRSFTKQMATTLTRVVPVQPDSSIEFETDTDDPTASVRNALTVASKPPVRLGTFKNSLTIGSTTERVPEILWQLPFQDPIEVMRAVPVPGKGLGLVFRGQNALWLGWVGEDRKAVGALHKIPGTGVKVGTPSLGWNGQGVLLTFADLEKADGTWAIRMAELRFGEPPDASFPWVVPEGGPGGALIAPAALGLADGRWVMVWTEGKPGSRAVRVQTLDDQLSPVGEPFVASRPGSNAGQGLAAVGKSGGAVIYLAALGQFYEVWGAGIDCP